MILVLFLPSAILKHGQSNPIQRSEYSEMLLLFLQGLELQQNSYQGPLGVRVHTSPAKPNKLMFLFSQPLPFADLFYSRRVIKVQKSFQAGRQTTPFTFVPGEGCMTYSAISSESASCRHASPAIQTVAFSSPGRARFACQY